MTTAKDRSLDRSDGNPLWVRIAAAKVAVAASKVTGRPVDPRVLELTEMPDEPPPGPGKPLWVRIAAAKVAVAASKVTGRPVDPRVLELTEMTVPD